MVDDSVDQKYLANHKSIENNRMLGLLFPKIVPNILYIYIVPNYVLHFNIVPKK